MSAHHLEKFLPDNTLPFLKVWFGNYNCHLKITRNRNSKLGDYRKMPDNSHQITINGTLEPQLFFFVLTHELAHLIAFEKYGRRISPHGQEWKQTFREMLLESLEAYQEDLKLIIKDFSKININEDEVDHIFLVPLSYFFETKPDIYNSKVSIIPDEDFPFNLLTKGENYDFKTGNYKIFFYNYNGYVIWGITAKIMNDFIKQCSRLDCSLDTAAKGGI